MLSWLTEMTIRRSNSMLLVLPWKCIDFFPLPSWISSLPNTGTTECWMIGFCESQQHFLCSSVPRSIWFVIVSSVPLLFKSRPWERPMTARDSTSKLFNCLWIVFTYFIISFCIPYNVVKHWHERWSDQWSFLVHTVILPSSVEED